MFASLLQTWRRWARALRSEAVVLLLAYRDPRVPWYAKLYLAGVLAYLFSPIDLIPDFIPVLGYLDELLLMPVFIAVARRLIPPAVLDEHRLRVAAGETEVPRSFWIGGVVVVLIWLAIAGFGVYAALRFLR